MKKLVILLVLILTGARLSSQPTRSVLPVSGSGSTRLIAAYLGALDHVVVVDR